MEKQTRKSNPSLVVKSNQLINSRYSLTVAEMRLFLLMIAQVERDDHDFKPYRIKIKDFAESIGSNYKDYYKTAEQSSRMLLGRVMEIPTAQGNLLQVSFLSSAEYFRGEGIIELSFDPKLRPYLLALKDRFTSYDIRNVMRLQSTHSMRIYELLKQFEPIGHRTFDVEELKRILSLEEQYKKYNDFKRYVILQAKKELSDHCDITFDFEELKKGKRVASICFTIIQQEKNLNGRPAPKAPEPAAAAVVPNGEEAKLAEVPADLLQMLLELGLSEGQALRYLRAKDAQYLREKALYVRQGTEEGKIKNPAAYLVALIEHDAQTIFPLYDVAAKMQAKKGRGGERPATSPPRPQPNERAQQELLRHLQAEFEVVRAAQSKELVQQAQPDDWDRFEQYVASVPYLKGKFFEQGTFRRDHPDAAYWFGAFLAEARLPEKRTAFRQWAASSKGIMLEYLPQADEYRVVQK